MDIYVKKFRPEASQDRIIKVGRVVTILGSVIAVLMTIAINNINGLNLFDVFQSILGFIAPPMSVVFLFGVLWQKTTTRAANFILTAGTAFSLGIGVLYLWVFPSNTYDFWPHYLLISCFIFLILCAVIVIISHTNKNKGSNEEALVVKKLPSPTKRVWVLWVALAIMMVALYIIFD